MTALYLIAVFIAIAIWGILSILMIPGWSAINYYLKHYFNFVKKFDDDVETLLEEEKEENNE